MPDFNKGDFTQQGVNGHVNATVRLNEKRLVNIDLTSNEEAEGCTIAGTVTDLLNDKVYPIGAGVSGNIEITENGENINVAPYATATVNVAGGGGLPATVCKITAVNNSGDSIETEPCCTEDDFILKSRTIANNSSLTIIGFYMYDTYFHEYLIATKAIIETSNSSDFTDLVNLTSLEDDGYYYLKVTDPTLTSSATINALLIKSEA